MTKSIIQKNTKRCFRCGGSASFEPLDRHHVYGAANRKNSEKYGLTVWLHHNTCHIFGKDSVHQNAETNNKLKKIAQEIAMKHYGWSVDDFIRIFGKSYL